VNPTHSIPDSRRRVFNLAFALSGAALIAPRPALLLAQEAQRRPTPAMAEGPFYPDTLPAERDADLNDSRPARPRRRHGSRGPGRHLGHRAESVKDAVPVRAENEVPRTRPCFRFGGAKIA